MLCDVKWFGLYLFQNFAVGNFTVQRNFQAKILPAGNLPPWNKIDGNITTQVHRVEIKTMGSAIKVLKEAYEGLPIFQYTKIDLQK